MAVLAVRFVPRPSSPFPSAYASASRLLRRYASDTRAILSSWPGSSLPSPILSRAAQILGIGISRARRDGRPQASGAGGTRELLSASGKLLFA